MTGSMRVFDLFRSFPNSFICIRDLEVLVNYLECGPMLDDNSERIR